MIFRSLEGKLQEGGFLKDMQKIWILQVQNLKFSLSTFSYAKCAGSALTTVVWMPNVELTEKKKLPHKVWSWSKLFFRNAFNFNRRKLFWYSSKYLTWSNEGEFKYSHIFNFMSCICAESRFYAFEHVFVFQDELSCYSQTLRTLQWSWKQNFPDWEISGKKKKLNC